VISIVGKEIVYAMNESDANSSEHILKTFYTLVTLIRQSRAGFRTSFVFYSVD
jgi:hypothetical protein